MATKQVTVIVLGADRQLWTGGTLQLRVTALRPGLPQLANEEFPGTSNTIQVNLNLPFDAGQAYGIQVDADDHRSAWQIIKRRTFLREEAGQTIEIDNAIFQLMLVPENPRSLDLDQGYDLLLADGSPMVSGPHPWPQDLYLDMGDSEKMAFLNIDAKLKATRINGLSIRSFVQGVSHVGPARVFLFVRPDLKELVETSSDFSSAQGHGSPDDSLIPLPEHPDSWKHNRFGAGNLQLSFSEETMSVPTDETQLVFSVDADIDLERGLLHAAEWLDNEVFHPGQTTDQTLVYALLFSQRIIPLYTISPIGVEERRSGRRASRAARGSGKRRARPARAKSRSRKK